MKIYFKTAVRDLQKDFFWNNVITIYKIPFVRAYMLVSRNKQIKNPFLRLPYWTSIIPFILLVIALLIISLLIGDIYFYIPKGLSFLSYFGSLILMMRQIDKVQKRKKKKVYRTYGGEISLERMRVLYNSIESNQP